MAQPVDDGGYAFPFPYIEDEQELIHPGATKREWFAGMALIGLMSDPGLRPSSTDEFAHMAKRLFQVADAMIAESKREGHSDER